MSPAFIALVIAVVIVGSLLIIFIQITSRRNNRLNQEAYRKVWRAISDRVNVRSSDSMQMTIVKADKLLDKAMRDYGVKGQTMGERLKARKGYWSSENTLWSAHKLRNQIAHEEEIKLSEKTFRRAMVSYEEALRDLGAL